jgi:predicted DNA-binding transcriptional regulator AlpA
MSTPINRTDITGRAAFSISEFCMRNGISYGTFYNLRRRGEGPREMKIGTRRLISVAAEAAWQTEREAAK